MEITVFNTTVFKDGQNGGNPCPVVLNADPLSSDQMRSLAKEWDREAAFIERVSFDKNYLAVRFFVPNHEMEMCGHGTIAAVTVAKEQGIIDPGKVIVRTGVGWIHCLYENDSDNSRVVVNRQRPEFHSESPSSSEVARALNIEESAVDTDIGPIKSVSTSRHKLVIPLSDVTTLNELEPNYQYLWKLCDQYDTTGFYPFAIADDEEIDVEARQFPNDAGYEEDPATGVAACALGAYLTNYRVLYESRTGNHSYQIAQGRAMNQPSLIESQIRLENGDISTTSIRGSATIEDVKIKSLK